MKFDVTMFPRPLCRDSASRVLTRSLFCDAGGNKITGVRLACPRCRQHFCFDCDLYIHESLHNCPGCESLSISQSETSSWSFFFYPFQDNSSFGLPCVMVPTLSDYLCVTVCRGSAYGNTSQLKSMPMRSSHCWSVYSICNMFIDHITFIYGISGFVKSEHKCNPSKWRASQLVQPASKHLWSAMFLQWESWGRILSTESVIPLSFIVINALNRKNYTTLNFLEQLRVDRK